MTRARKEASAGKKNRIGPPQSGQSGLPINFSKADLNAKELKVAEALLAGEAPLPLEALALICFADVGIKSGSWARNSLRRLVRAKWVNKVGKGTYIITPLGREKMAENVEGVSRNKRVRAVPRKSSETQ